MKPCCVIPPPVWKPSKCQLTVAYMYDRPAITLDVQEVHPGLCVRRNPKHGDYPRSPKYAVLHKATGLIIGATKTMRDARALADRLAPLVDWTREMFTMTELRPAKAIVQEYAV
jgi:hypothetical protein